MEAHQRSPEPTPITATRAQRPHARFHKLLYINTLQNHHHIPQPKPTLFTPISE